MRNRRIGAFSLAVVIALLATAGVCAADPPPAIRNVLLLYSESRVLPAVVRIDEGLRAHFSEAGVQAELFPEYLDLSSSTHPGYTTDLLAFLRAKHRHRKFDLVIAAGTLSLRFALASRGAIFPSVPIVFCAVTPNGAGDLRHESDVTGVFMVTESAATVAAARRLQPAAKRLVVVTGASALDRVRLADVQRDLAGRTEGLEVTYLAGRPLTEVRETLRALSPTTIVLFAWVLGDASGRSVSGREVLAQLAPVSGAPIYVVSDVLLGAGAVGGRMVSFEAQGRQAAGLALRVLAGEPAGRIGPVARLANAAVFDGRELRRWNLPERDLPPDAVVVNREPSLWQVYRWHIVATIGLILGEAALIGALLIHRRRRRHAERTLHERLTFETFVSNLSASFVDQHGADADAALERGLQLVGEHLGLDRAMAMELSAAAGAIRVTHAWTAPGADVPPWAIDVGGFTWLVERLRHGPVRFAGLHELPADAALDRESFASLGIRSAVIVPLMDGPHVIGAITFSLTSDAQARSYDLPERLEFVGGIFASLLLRRRIETELQTLRRDLTHVGRVSALGELAVSLAHELNQPLAAILTNAQVVERLLDSGGMEPKELREIVGEIVADDKRAGEIIQRLRSFVKKDSPQRSPLALNAVIQDVVLLVHSDVIIRNVALVLDLESDLPPVSADRVHLQQVVLNLIVNGLDAIRGATDRHLGIATRVNDEGNLEVAVSDRGGGVPERDLRRIFDAFYTTKPHGLGMGLSISRSLIEAHGGRLWACNNPQGGATFTFTLPADGIRDATKV